MNEVKMAHARMQEPDALSTTTRENDELAALAKALGHPARLGIVRILHERRTCIGCDIVDQIGLAQSTTSEHLRILKAAGIITGEVDSPRVCYSLNSAALEPLRRFLDEIADPAREPAKDRKEPLHVHL
jgi:ArsR family transcriptional regulator